MGAGAFGSGCGGPAKVAVKPPKVPEGLVPSKVAGDELAFSESALPGVKDAFANAGPTSLTADGRLWELRKGDRLVGALELATLMPKVNLEKKNHREQILRQIMPGVVDQLSVDVVPVWTSRSNDKSLFVWFGRNVYAVLSLKGAEGELDDEKILDEVVRYNLSSDSWRPLYIADESAKTKSK
jgi:hypothetical protein